MWRVVAAAVVLLGAGGVRAAEQLQLQAIDSRDELIVHVLHVDQMGQVVRDAHVGLRIANGSAEPFGDLRSSAWVKPSTAPAHVVVVAQRRAEIWNAVDEARERLVAAVPSGTFDMLGYDEETIRIEDVKQKLPGEPAGPNTEWHLLDAVRASSESLRAHPKGERRFIWIISDGVDAGSPPLKAYAAAGKRLEERGVIADTIQWGCAGGAFEKIAALSGGVARCARTVEELRDRIDELTRQARGGIEVGFGRPRTEPVKRCDSLRLRAELPSGLVSNPVDLPVICGLPPPIERRRVPWAMLGGAFALLSVLVVAWVRRRARSAR